MNGWVYAAFASYCDRTPYEGYVAGVSTTTRALTLWTDEAGLTDSEGGIWQSGGGLVSDGSGRIFVATGTGVPPAPGAGDAPPAELGDAVVRLKVGSDGTLSAADFFSPANAPALYAQDKDLGSGGPVGLPFGTGRYPHLLVQAGKDGRVFLLDSDDLGGREQGPGGTDDDVSEAGPYPGQWGHPAVFGPDPMVSSASSGDYVYYVGNDDVMRYLQFGVSGSGVPVLTDVADSSTRFGYSSGSPVVTSDGASPASAVVWEVRSSGPTGAGGTLEAFDAVPPAGCKSTAPCTMAPIWSAPIGTASKFDVPATSNGIVYVGSRDGDVLAFGSPDRAPLSSAPLDFGGVAAGSPATRQLTVTATRAVTISAVTASGAAFSRGSVALPVSLAAGQQLTVPVTFRPPGPGGATGGLAFATDSANYPTVTVGLAGDGTRPGLYATPSALSFGSVPDGTAAQAAVTISNGGTASETVTAVVPPGVPFRVTGLPSACADLGPGASVTVTVTYSPATTGAGRGSLTVDGSAGNVAVALSGTGAADNSSLTAAPAAAGFGSVPLGQQATSTIKITNAGNLPATVTAAVAPAVPFGAPDPVAAGLTVSPGSELEVPVTFTPASTGPAAGSYTLTWHDAAGSHLLSVPVSGTGTAPSAGIAVPPPGGGWTLNGSARMTGTSLVLTGAAAGQAGSAVYSVPVPSNGLTATFTAQMGGGSGADGMTMSLLDAAGAAPTALGADGGELGFGGLHGIAVALDTHQDPGYPSGNFIGIATGGSDGELRFAATATDVPGLRSGKHTIGVSVAGQKVTVSIDGKTVLSPTLAAGSVPGSVLAAFTAGTGGDDDDHAVTTASINSGSTSLPPPGGGWSYNAAAGMSGPDTTLTPAVKFSTGSVIYPVPVRTSGLQVQFDAQLSGGTGADGLTFALLRPSVKDISVGGDGAELGFGGLPGVAATLDTHQDAGYPAGNFAGLSSGTSGSLLSFQSSALVIPPLRSGTHTVKVQVTSDSGTPVVVVWLDGELVLAQPEPDLGPTALLAFTGGTGGLTDVHTVRDVAIYGVGLGGSPGTTAAFRSLRMVARRWP